MNTFESLLFIVYSNVYARVFRYGINFHSSGLQSFQSQQLMCFSCHGHNKNIDILLGYTFTHSFTCWFVGQKLCGSENCFYFFHLNAYFVISSIKQSDLLSNQPQYKEIDIKHRAESLYYRDQDYVKVEHVVIADPTTYHQI